MSVYSDYFRASANFVAAEESKFTWLIRFLVFLPACYGALTYRYCRTAITGFSLTTMDALHFLPLAICYLLNYDLLFSPEKALSFVRMSEVTLLRHTLTIAVFYGQMVVYTVLLVRMVSRYQTKAKQTLSSYNPDIFKWLWSLIAFTVSNRGLKALFYFMTLAPIVDILDNCLLVLMVYFIAVVQWRNPSLFHIQQLAMQLATHTEQATTPSRKQASDSLLEQDTRGSILRAVQNLVKEKALYRNSELTLADLAEQVGISVHHLSETLNQYGGKNFNQFINEYRVAEVCEQLDQISERKLIDLALDAGFSSKSCFNAIFKKLTGQTPSVYRLKLASH